MADARQGFNYSRNVELIVDCIGISLQDALSALAMKGRMLALREAKDNNRWRLAGERTIIAHIGPKPDSLACPRASSSTVVSSPCSRSASICASLSTCHGVGWNGAGASSGGVTGMNAGGGTLPSSPSRYCRCHTVSIERDMRAASRLLSPGGDQQSSPRRCGACRRHATAGDAGHPSGDISLTATV